MNAYLIGMLAYFLLIAPMDISVRLSFGTGEYLNGMLSVRLWGVGAAVWWTFGRQDDGTLTLTLTGKEGGEGKPPDIGRALRRLRVLYRAYTLSNYGRRLLRGAVKLRGLNARCVVGCSDACSTAILTGTLIALSEAIKREGPADILVRADFRGATRVQASGIFSARLGMLLGAGLCFLFAYLRAKGRVKGAKGTWKNRTSAA